jgi:transcriptional regulator with XRE-family HTH domain
VDIAHELKKARGDRSLRQAARAIGIEPSAYRAWEEGFSQPKAERADATPHFTTQIFRDPLDSVLCSAYCTHMLNEVTPTPRSREAGEQNWQRIKDLLDKDMSPRKIARELDLSESYVYQQLRRRKSA